MIRCVRIAAVAGAALLAACAPTAPTASVAPGASPEVSAGPVVGCVGIEPAECAFVAERVLEQLPDDRGAPFAIQVFLAACPNDGACPPTLAVRKGSVTVEYADRAEPITLFVEGPPATPRFGEAMRAWAGPFDPRSPRVAGAGPFPFELGHCGLLWQVDFDGSFWLPVGEVDGDAPAVINAERGHIRLLDARLAVFTGESGFTATLARFPGAKYLLACD